MKRIFFFAALLLALFAPRHSEAQLAFDLSASTCTLTAGANQVHTEGGTCGGTSDGSLIRLTDAPSAGGCTGTPGTTARLCIYDASQDALLASSSGNVEALSTVGASGTAPVSNGSGGVAMTDIATQSELAAQITARHPQEFLVADYGAIPNDGLEDHTAFNAALDAACAAGGGAIVTAPGAVYDFGAGTAQWLGIQVECSNIVIRSSQPGEKSRFRALGTGAGQYIATVGTGQYANGLLQPTASTKISNITFRDIVFEDTVTPSSYQRAGVYLMWSDGVVFENVECIGLGSKCVYTVGIVSGTTLRSPTNVTFRDMRISNTPSYGTSAGGSFGLAALDINDSKDVLIDNLRCSDGPNSTAYNRACIHTVTNSAARTDNVRITNSYFGSGYSHGIYTDDADNLTIEHNFFEKQSVAAIEITDGDYAKSIKIRDNDIYGKVIVNGSTQSLDLAIEQNSFDGTIYSGTESGTSTTSTMEVTGAGLTVDAYIGRWIECTSGTCDGDSHEVTDNDGDTFDISPATWAGGTPNSVTFRVVVDSAVTVGHSGNFTGSIASNPSVKNYFAAAFDIAAPNTSLERNRIANTGMDASPCVVESSTPANNAGSWAILGNVAQCNDAAVGAISADWSGATQLTVSDNMLSGTALGTAIDAYSTVMRGNSISGFVTGMKPRRSVSLVSNNYAVVSGDSISIEGSVIGTVLMGNAMATGVNEQDSANYSAMVGNFSLAGGIECSTLNGGVGTNDICLGNVGMKDILSATGVKITSGTEPPGSCTDGEIFQDTDAATGTQLMSCESGVFVTQ